MYSWPDGQPDNITMVRRSCFRCFLCFGCEHWVHKTGVHCRGGGGEGRKRGGRGEGPGWGARGWEGGGSGRGGGGGHGGAILGPRRAAACKGQVHACPSFNSGPATLSTLQILSGTVGYFAGGRDSRGLTLAYVDRDRGFCEQVRPPGIAAYLYPPGGPWYPPLRLCLQRAPCVRLRSFNALVAYCITRIALHRAVRAALRCIEPIELHGAALSAGNGQRAVGRQEGGHPQQLWPPVDQHRWGGQLPADNTLHVQGVAGVRQGSGAAVGSDLIDWIPGQQWAKP